MQKCTILQQEERKTKKGVGWGFTTSSHPTPRAKEVGSVEEKSQTYGAGEPIHVEAPLPKNMRQT